MLHANHDKFDLVNIYITLHNMVRGQTNWGYKNTNQDTDIHLLIFVCYKQNRILDKGIRIG